MEASFAEAEKRVRIPGTVNLKMTEEEAKELHRLARSIDAEEFEDDNDSVLVERLIYHLEVIFDRAGVPYVKRPTPFEITTAERY